MEKSEQPQVWIQGGGIAGCLLLAALRHKWPNLTVRIFERADHLGGSHTWCFHEGDIPKGATAWLKPLISQTWPGYDVQFPKFSRSFDKPYHGIRSQDLFKKIQQSFPEFLNLSTTDSAFQTQLEEAKARGLDVTVITATGWPHLQNHPYGYQKFVGLDVELKNPHGLKRALLKDVTIPQTDGYRFFYLLPWSENSLLVEDTYYSNSSELNVVSVDSEIRNYIKAKGWEIQKIHRRETGCLPIPLYREPTPTGAMLGAASGLAQPVTGYTLPQTLATIQNFLNENDPSQAGYLRALEKTRKFYQGRFRYLRLLNRMMFLAGTPDKRYQILERFYGLSESLIERFYSGRLTWRDRIRVLVGKPPVPVLEALKVLRDDQPHDRNESSSKP